MAKASRPAGEYLGQTLKPTEVRRLDQMADIGAKRGMAMPVNSQFSPMEEWALNLGAREAQSCRAAKSGIRSI